MKISNREELMATLEKCQPVNLLEVQRNYWESNYLPRTCVAYTQLRKGGFAE
jgi:hypothetical protein